MEHVRIAPHVREGPILDWPPASLVGQAFQPDADPVRLGSLTFGRTVRPADPPGEIPTMKTNLIAITARAAMS